MGIVVFVSYATKDASKFKVKELAEQLKKKPQINEVLYWEKSAHGSIIKYMEQNIKRCDHFLLVCSQHSVKSEPIQDEWETAKYLGKPILPIFLDVNFVPTLLRRLRGIRFQPHDLKNTVDEIYREILFHSDRDLAEKLEAKKKKTEEITIDFMGRQLKGKPTIAYFWEPGNYGCEFLNPHIKKLREKYQNVNVVLINIENENDHYKGENQRFRYYSDLVGVGAPPLTLFFNADGKLVAHVDDDDEKFIAVLAEKLAKGGLTRELAKEMQWAMMDKEKVQKLQDVINDLKKIK